MINLGRYDIYLNEANGKFYVPNFQGIYPTLDTALMAIKDYITNPELKKEFNQFNLK